MKLFGFKGTSAAKTAVVKPDAKANAKSAPNPATSSGSETRDEVRQNDFSIVIEGDKETYCCLRIIIEPQHFRTCILLGEEHSSTQCC